MKCSKCGTELENGSNICPNCQNVVTYEDIEEIEELSNNINENMAPPSLDVNNENLISGVEDISSSSENEALYEVNPEEKITNTTVEDNNTIDAGNVNIEIPSVSEVVENADNVTGVTSEAEKNDKKKIKFKIDIKAKIPMLYALIGGVVAIMLGYMLGSSTSSGSVSHGSCYKNNNSLYVVSDGKNGVINVKGFQYTIPDNYVYDKTEDGLLIYNKDASARIFVRVESGSYENLATSKTSIKETMIAQGITVKTIDEKKVKENGIPYIMIETFANSKENRFIAFRKYDDEHLFYIEIIDQENSYSSDLIKSAMQSIDDILTNTKKLEEAPIEKVGVLNFSNVVITAANENKRLNSN